MKVYTKEDIALDLLEIGAVFLRPDDPFTWASGIKSPIYCDNRLLYSFPQARSHVEEAFSQMIPGAYPGVEMLMGTAMGGIGHAAITAHLLKLPMGYVRPKPKDHGRGNLVEGKCEKGQKVVVVEDLISTAASVLETVAALRGFGAEVLGIASIFTYGMQKGLDNMKSAAVVNHSLCDYPTLLRVAAQNGYIKPQDMARLERFMQNPRDESWMEV